MPSVPGHTRTPAYRAATALQRRRLVCKRLCGKEQRPRRRIELYNCTSKERNTCNPQGERSRQFFASAFGSAHRLYYLAPDIDVCGVPSSYGAAAYEANSDEKGSVARMASFDGLSGLTSPFLNSPIADNLDMVPEGNCAKDEEPLRHDSRPRARPAPQTDRSFR